MNKVKIAVGALYLAAGGMNMHAAMGSGAPPDIGAPTVYFVVGILFLALWIVNWVEAT